MSEVAPASPVPAPASNSESPAAGAGKYDLDELIAQAEAINDEEMAAQLRAKKVRHLLFFFF